jgi:hypothetical protein
VLPMRTVLASSFSNALLGGLATWAFLSVGSSLVWAAVIAWGCFFHTGGNAKAVRITIVGNALGVFFAWLGGNLLVVNPPSIPAPIWAGLAIFSIVIVMVFIGHNIAGYLNYTTLVIPASFYGAASTFAFLVQTPNKLSPTALHSFSFDNALIAVPIAMVVGAFLGLATAKMTTALATPKSEVGVSEAA